MLVAPVCQCRTFVLGSGDITGDDIDSLDSKRLKLPNRSFGRALVGDPTANELLFHGGNWNVCKNGDSSCHPTLNQVRGFEHTDVVGIDRNGDNICVIGVLIDNEYPSSGTENRPTHRNNTEQHTPSSLQPSASAHLFFA